MSKLQAFDKMSGVVGSAIAKTGLYSPTPEVAKLCLAIAVALELIGALLFVVGKEKMGARMLALFLILVRCRGGVEGGWEVVRAERGPVARGVRAWCSRRSSSQDCMCMQRGLWQPSTHLAPPSAARLRPHGSLPPHIPSHR